MPRRPPLLPLALAALAALTCAGAARGGARSLLLVTFDTTRADRIGAYGYTGAATPTLDRLAAEGLVFGSAVSPTPITLPSHASLLTGVLPARHGVRDNAVFVLGPEATLLSEVLRAAGLRTGAFVGAVVLDAQFGLDQGFEVYRGPTFGDPRPGVITERRADAVVDDAVAWLETLEPGERFFAWVHFFDPHFPYDPPPPWSQQLASPYDGEIAFCDAQLARLLRFLSQRSMDEGLLTVVTADHGESLGEHGEPAHGLFLYQSSLHVPLVFHGAGVKPGRVEGAVSTAALAATLASLAGLPAASMPEVKQPLLVAKDGSPVLPSPDALLFLETHYPFHTHRWRASRGLVRGRQKLIDAGAPELYDLARDPAEGTDLASQRGDEVAALQRGMQEWLDANPPLGWGVRRDSEAGEREMLEALGYVTPSVGERPFDPSLPDARDRLDDADRISRAYDLALRARRLSREPGATAWQQREREAEGRELLESARALLLEVRAANPRDPEAARHLATVETRLGNHVEAIALLEPRVRENPRLAELRFSLGVNYKGAGRMDDAVAEMQKAAELSPGYPQPVRWLASHAERRGDLDEALRWLNGLARALPADAAPMQEVRREIRRLEAERARRTPPATPSPQAGVR